MVQVINQFSQFDSVQSIWFDYFGKLVSLESDLVNLIQGNQPIQSFDSINLTSRLVLESDHDPKWAEKNSRLRKYKFYAHD